MNRPARFTVADLRRAGIAAQQLGRGWRVDIAPDGTISLVQGDPHQAPPTAPEQQPEPVEEKVTILF